MSRALKIGAVVAAVVIAAWVALTWPGFHGYHSGYNAATDNVCKTWLGQQYCRHVTTEAELRERAAHEQEARHEREVAALRREHERQVRCSEGYEPSEAAKGCNWNYITHTWDVLPAPGAAWIAGPK
jgi:hypothetical protein